MLTLSKRPAFLVATRALVLFYVAALLQLYALVSCACAEVEAVDYEHYVESVQKVAESKAPCCCSARSGPETDAVGENLFDGNMDALCSIQADCCCLSDNDLGVPDVHVSNVEFKLTGESFFRVLSPSFCMTGDSHGAYPAGYHAHVLSIAISSHIASTILLL